jgi:hypothetical protein
MLKYSETTQSALFVPSTAQVRTMEGGRPTSSEMIRIYQIYLKESGLLPSPKGFDDVLRLREDKHIRSLRRALWRWVETHPDVGGDLTLLSDMRAEISAASAAVKKLEGPARLANLVGYIALPISVAEAITGGSLIGLLLAPSAQQSTHTAFSKLRRFGWIKFGR